MKIFKKTKTMKTDFSPYSTIADNEHELQLELNQARRKMLFVFHKVLPFILISIGAMSFIIMLQKGAKTLGIMMFTLTVIVSLIIAFETYLLRLTITQKKLTILKSSLIRSKIEKTYGLNETQKIVFEIFKAKGGGGYFYLVTDYLKKIKFFEIPLHYLDKKNAISIGQRFSERAGIPFEIKHN